MTDQNEVLRKCPCCGSAPRRSMDIQPIPPRHAIGCSRCIVATEWASEAEAIAAWNTRPTTQPAPRDRKAVLEALEPFAKLAEQYDPPEGDDSMPLMQHDGDELNLGDLRRARSVLDALRARGAEQ